MPKFFRRRTLLPLGAFRGTRKMLGNRRLHISRFAAQQWKSKDPQAVGAKAGNQRLPLRRTLLDYFSVIPMDSRFALYRSPLSRTAGRGLARDAHDLVSTACWGRCVTVGSHHLEEESSTRARGSGSVPCPTSRPLESGYLSFAASCTVLICRYQGQRPWCSSLAEHVSRMGIFELSRASGVVPSGWPQGLCMDIRLQPRRNRAI
jgi:hypothetical protein